MPTIETLFPKPLTLGDLMKSSDEVSVDAGTAGHNVAEGSYENTISLVARPTIKATPCPGAADSYYYGGELDGAYHFPAIVGTFDDHTIVGCDGCDRFWKVPYEVRSEDGRATVMVGEPESRVRAFMAPQAAANAISDPPTGDPDPGTTDPTPVGDTPPGPSDANDGGGE